MKIAGFPNNQDTFVGAEWLIKWFHGRSSGIFGENGGGVVAAVPGAMQVTLTDCVGWLSNSEGDGIVWWNDTQKRTGKIATFNVPTADSLMDRVDRIIVSWPTTDYAELPDINYVAGKPASNPKPPALANTQLRREISLARINVKAGTTKITPDKITDERLDPAVCGLVTENIKADTSMVNEQFKSLFSTLEAQIEQAIAKTVLDNSVTTLKIKNGAVTTPKLGDGAVTRPKLAGDLLIAVENSEIAHQGTSNIWHYIKYKSGLAVCWGTGEPISTVITTPWGGCFESDKSSPSRVLPFEFTEVYVNLGEMSNIGCNLLTVRIAEGQDPSRVADRAPAMWGFRPTSYDSPVTMLPYYLVVGRWK